MNRKLKRVIASFLAVIMVAFAVPFTASAAYDSNGFASWSDTQANGGIPIGWWGDGNYKQWENDNIPYGEQDYDGLNDLGEDNLIYSAWCDSSGYTLMVGGTSFAPYTDNSGWVNNMSDDLTTITDEYSQAAYDHLSDMKPVVTITVSDQGNSNESYTTWARNKYYGYRNSSGSTMYLTEDVEAAGNLMNPGDLKAGDRIAVTIEIGGMDSIQDASVKGIFNTEYLVPGYYTKNPTASNYESAWTTDSTSDATTASMLQYCNYYTYLSNGNTYNVAQGTQARTSGGVSALGAGSAGYGRYEEFGDTSIYGQFMCQVCSGYTTPSSTYIGNDGYGDGYAQTQGYDTLQDLLDDFGYDSWDEYVDGEGLADGGSCDSYYGDNGVVVLTLSFEVLQDCDLMDVFFMDDDLSGSAPTSVTYFGAYATTGAYSQIGYSAYQFNFDDVAYGSDTTENTKTSYSKTYGLCALEVANYTPSSSGGETEYTYGDPVFDWAEDYSTCTATFTANEDETVTETVECTVTSETTAATCTEDGNTTYTATATFNDTEYTDTQTVAISASGHTAAEAVKENEVAATCTTDGSYEEVVYCSVCGAEISRETVTVAATGHDYEAVVTAPTCTEGGYTTYTCSVCGDSYTADETAATGHTWGEGVVTTAATCTDEGVLTYTCETCGETKTEAISATGHTAGEAVTENEVAATCTTDGSYDTVVYCTVCDAEISRETTTVPALGHSYEAVVTAPTCTEQGYTTYTCSTCGDSYVTDYVDALGHSYDDGVVTTEATCTTDGVKTYTCSVCGDTYTEEIAATGHSYEAVVTAPTCTEQGYTTYTCSACGDSYVADYTEATGHSYDDGVVTTAATCTEEGVMTYTCSVCGDSYTEAIAATGHTEGTAVTENYVAATYTTEGSYDTVVYCSVCGEELSRVTTTIPVSTCDHENTYVTGAVDATCTTDGYTGDTYCSDCGALVAAGEVIAAKGHTEAEAVVENEVAATCGTDGSYDSVVYCSVCGEEISRETVTVAATGEHTYDDGTVTTAATCTEEGVMTYTCTVCGATKTEAIAATGHTEGEAVVENEVAATCTAEGSYDNVVYCSVCGEELSRETVTTDKIAHTAGEAVVENEVAATYTSAGSYDSVVYCSVCGEEISRTTITIPMLTDGVTVAVNEVDLGVITVEGDTDGDQSVTVARNSSVTLTATPVDGAEFVGWALNSKIVSTDATYTVTALADVTYTAVFTETAESSFVVVFTDSYGNVIDTQEVTSGTEIDDETPATLTSRPGYTFTGWSLTADEIDALTSGATIVAQYAKDAATSYTVTASGATITTSSASATDSLSDVAYDTEVTVYVENATSWSVNDVVVAYGDTYTFYVGADITLVANFDEVTATPAVAITNADDSGVVTDTATTSSGLIKAYFLATRTMTDDCTYVSSGFIYGKSANVTAATTLDDVDNSTVKRADTSTTSEQFSLSYGLSAQSGSVSAKAYLAYVDGDGNTQVIYSDLATFTY